MKKITYSVVIPVYNSAPILPRLLADLDKYFSKKRSSHEFIFVNDGSKDDSWKILQKLKKNRSDIMAIDLMKNYGQHSAVFCGFQLSSGKFVITMDDDLQNPPKEIDLLTKKMQEGYDVVFGSFKQKMHGPIRGVGSKLIGWLNHRLFGKPKDLVLTNFRIIRREVIDAVCQFQTTAPYIPGLILMSADRFANVTVEHKLRSHGKSQYTWKVISKLVWRILINYSALPIRLLCAVSAGVAVISLALGSYYLVKSLMVGTIVRGWTTLVVLLSFYQGLSFLILAVFGEYMVRMVNDVSGQKAYRIRKRL